MKDNTTVQTKRKKGFLATMVEWGEVIGNFFIIQFQFVIYTLRGGIILGVFPAVAATFNFMFQFFIDKDSMPPLMKGFSDSWKKHFKSANQVGYTLLLSFGFLYFDLRINENVIQSSVLHTLLLILIFILGFVTIYTFTVLVGHSLTFKQTLKQAFFVSLSTPMFTIAAILGLMIMYELLNYFIFIAIFFGAPLIILPIAWFTFSGLQKIDELKKEMSVD